MRQVNAHTLTLVVLILAGCASSPPQECALNNIDASLVIDISAVDFSAVSQAEICNEDKCQPMQISGQDLIVDNPVLPRSSSVEVTLIVTGENRQVAWTAEGLIELDEVYPNGPQCGSKYLYPQLQVEADYSLRSV